MNSNVVNYANEDVGFYPTPSDLVDKMLDLIDWDKSFTILEPSAGKGNIVDAIQRKAYLRRYSRYGDKSGVSVDCIEIDPDLRGILEYKYGGGQATELRDRIRSLDSVCNEYDGSENGRQLKALRNEEHILESTPVVVVYDDFLTFTTYKRYDVIVMNPPFANGDEHLIHALTLLRHGGKVICLLNAETIRNPYTNRRKALIAKLDKYEAKIRYIQNAFRYSERNTDVEIAMVEVDIPQKEETSFIFEGLKKAQEAKTESAGPQELTSGDFLEQIVQQFNFEVNGTIRLIREYEAIKPYMLSSFEEGCKDAILTLSLSKDERNYFQVCDVNKYLKIVRMKYWRALFKNKQFTGALTENLLEKYMNMLDSMGDYDFTMFNIRAFQQKMMSELVQGVGETILALFDKLSEAHSWYPECGTNIHYFNGWATNKAHMINTKKVIIPTYGCYSSYSWESGKLNESAACKALSDLEKVFNYLDNGETSGPDLREQVKAYAAAGITKKIPLKYFFATFYKKGTCHIEWRVPELVEKLNIYGCQRKNWLPPSYGKKHYADMTPEEKTVVDEFQGEEAYAKVMARTDYYLMSDAAIGVKLLTTGAETELQP
ncbi:MAG: DUF4942 domain-containing protein [Clostridia bacterium]|nr:DUF4942 domain-containing protein [Clostridia bacterium]